MEEQNDVERDLRVKERAHARRKEIKELEIIEKEKERAGEKELKKLEHEEKEREHKRGKEMKGLDHEKQKELKLLELKNEREKLDIEAKKTEANTVSGKITQPIFNEERDKFNTFYLPPVFENCGRYCFGVRRRIRRLRHFRRCFALYLGCY